VDGWSAADPDGLCSLRLDDPRRASLRGKRLRRAAQAGQALALDAWPEAERRLLQEWLKRGHARPLKRDTLYAMAGPSRAMAADRVLERLLRLGHIETEEKLEHGSWWLQRISFLNPLALYAQLGLEAPEQARQALETARIEAQTLHHPALQALAAGLAQGTPTRVALQRHQLLQSLDQWQQEGRSGTWRDFGLFARGDTKAITDTERKWLEAGLGLDLDSFHIQSHTPLLLIRASGQLHLPGGHFSLNLLPGFSALTPDSLRLCQGGSQAPACWLVLENLSAFEHVARHLPDGHGALWLPGYPPGWWREAVGLLLRHLPAPARTGSLLPFRRVSCGMRQAWGGRHGTCTPPIWMRSPPIAPWMPGTGRCWSASNRRHCRRPCMPWRPIWMPRGTRGNRKACSSGPRGRPGWTAERLSGWPHRLHPVTAPLT
jgi:hypothetical protein